MSNTLFTNGLLVLYDMLLTLTEIYILHYFYQFWWDFRIEDLHYFSSASELALRF
jgi:hypothetical protein